jgi:transposase
VKKLAVSSLNMLSSPPVKTSFFLKKRFALFLVFLALDAVFLGMLIAGTIAVIIPLIFASSHYFANYQFFFSPVFRHAPPLIFSLIFLLRFFAIVYYFPFSKFVYLWEIQNYDIIRNRASALLFPAGKNGNNENSLFQDALQKETESLLSRTTVRPLLPVTGLIYKIAAIAILLIWFFSAPPASFIPAVRHLINPDATSFSFSFPKLQNAYLKNQAFLFSGQITPEPFFPLQIKVYDTATEKLLETHFIHSLAGISDEIFRFEQQMTGFDKNISIQVNSGNSYSDKIQLRIVDFPGISENLFETRPPAYSDREPLTASQLPFFALEGTAFRHEVHFNKLLSNFKLLTEGSGKLSEKNIGTTTRSSVEISGILSSDISYTINFTDQDGFSDSSLPFKWRVQKDKAPQISVFSPQSPLRVKAGKFNFPELEVKIEDDLKIKRAEMEIRSRQRFEMTYLSQKYEIPLPVESIALQIIKTTVTHPQIFLTEGDRISWNISAVDFFPGREASVSETGIIMVPYFFEEHEEAEQQSQEIINDFEQLTKSEKETAEKAAKIESELQEATENFSNRAEEQLQEFLQERQENIKDALDIKDKLDQHLKEERENRLLDEGNLRKLFQIQELYEQIVRDMQIDLSAMQQQNNDSPSLSTEKMQEMMQNFNQEKFAEELDRNLEGLKRVHARRQIKKNIARLSHLMETHQEMEKIFAGGQNVDNAELATKKEMWQQINSELKELMENPHLPESLREELKKELSANEEQINSDYENLQAANEENKPEAALDSNQSLQKKLSRLHNSLQEKYTATEKEIMHVNLQKLHFFISEILHSADYLLFISRGINLLSGVRLKQFAEENLALFQSALDNLIREMENEYRENLNFQGIILQTGALIREKQSAYTKIFQAEHVRNEQTPLTEIRQLTNQLALMLLQLKQKLEEQQSDMDMENYLESLEKLLQQQKQVGQKTREIKSQSPAMQQKLMEQMAFQQQLIRESTQKLYQQYQKKMELAANLNEAATEMAEVEKRLKAGDSGEETQKLQEKIEYRLLEAQNALEEQKEGSKRRGKAAEISELPQKGSLQSGEGDEEHFANAMKSLNTEHIPDTHRKIAEKYFLQLQGKN